MLKLRRERIEEAEVEVAAAIVDPALLGNGQAPAPIGTLLLSSGAIDSGELASALAVQSSTGRRLGSLLLENGMISQDQLDEALSKQSGIPLLDLRRTEPAPEALAMVPESLARANDIIPVAFNDGTLSVVIADPHDRRLPAVLKSLRVDNVQVFLASLLTIREAINSSYTALAGIGDLLKEATGAGGGRLRLDGNDDSNEGPVTEVVDRIVAQAMRDRASDVHLEPTDEVVRVRYRIDGALNEVIELPAIVGPAMVSRIKIMAGMNIVEKRRPQDGQFRTTVDGKDLDVRVSTTATIFGEKAVLRLLDKSRSMFDLVDLGMPADVKERFDAVVNSPFGMVVVSGPTGSGKTTTLYATLTRLARPDMNVTTIEDPVEYVFPSINQIEINVQAGVTFAGGLRSILRQDPDVILVGEIRDAETAAIAVQAALTGHLVLSSLHATDSASALFRLLDMGVERFLVASSLTGVVAQRLLRRTCKTCSAPYEPTAVELAYYRQSGGPEKTQFFRGTGCNYCSHSGYRDRIGIYEVLSLNDDIRHSLMTGGSPQDIRGIAIQAGMRTLRDEAIRLIADDVTTIEEVSQTIYTL
jgi:type IV pilus assembly protein PilB